MQTKEKNIIAEIICVGTELLPGNTINTNAAFLGKELSQIGFFTYFHTVVGDNPNRLKQTLELAFARADVVILTGGLGPTFDDLTKETVANFFDLEMELHQHSLERINNFFKKMNRTVTPNNQKQAMMPKGAVVFDNHNGTAPALAVVGKLNKFVGKLNESNKIEGEKIAILLPGPPRELEPIFTEQVKPFLCKKFNNAQVLVSKMVNIFGMGESAVEAKLYDLMVNSSNPTIAPYAKMGEVELRVTALGENEKQCNEILAPVIEQIKKTLGNIENVENIKTIENLGNVVYGIDCGSLQDALVSLLKEKKLTVATAESCTGGLVGKRITDVAGSSEVYLGGVVAYSDEAKVNILGVSKETVEKFGAVSEETACEMAKQASLLFGSALGISTTGIAGPAGGTSEKPVGLVYVGVFERHSKKNFAVKFNLYRGYADSRKQIRYLASSNALYEGLKILWGC
jgi:nicotinamide-nucleotide amidase